MDDFELKPEPTVKKRSPLIWNLLTILTLLGACGLAYYFYIIYSNPNLPYNPFPPAVIPTRFQTITPTSTFLPLPPTWTPTQTRHPYSTRTKAPTWTPITERTSTNTEVPTVSPADGTLTVSPTTTLLEGTLTITPTPVPAMAEFTYQASTTKHADSGCAWMGVGGEVLSADGKPLQFQTVQLGGTLDGKSINRMMYSGNVPAYGISGFEFLLGDHPIASTQELWIQLFDNTGKQMTEKIFFDTYTDCNRNLVMVVFTKAQ